MRMSCNGCRVLRKGCSEECSIRPCLEWISCPESQANATVFLAKFYGRAGLVNLVDAGPRHLRPAIFKSLLYEACGRIVSPISGSVGLISSGDGQLCHDAVEAVLKGDPITRMDTEFMEVKNWPSLVAGDIRHINKHGNLSESKDLHRVRTRCNLKRSASKSKPRRVWIEDNGSNEKELSRSLSHDSSLSQQSEISVPEVEPPCEAPGSPDPDFVQSDVNTNSDGEIELDLTLSLEPAKRCAKPAKAGGSRKIGLRLDCSVS